MKKRDREGGDNGSSKVVIEGSSKKAIGEDLENEKGQLR